MKKILIVLFLISIFSFSISPALAEQKNNRKPTAIVNTATKAANLEDQRTKNTVRVRTAVTARWNAYDRLVTLTGQLLDKLQIRIDRAKTAGQNTSSAETAMSDARARLADAKLQMDGIKGVLGTTMDKNSFLTMQKKLQAVHKDLNIVRQDAAKIISNLKSFNASTKSAEIRSTSSAKEK